VIPLEPAAKLTPSRLTLLPGTGSTVTFPACDPDKPKCPYAPATKHTTASPPAPDTAPATPDTLDTVCEHAGDNGGRLAAIEPPPGDGELVPAAAGMAGGGAAGLTPPPAGAAAEGASMTVDA